MTHPLTPREKVARIVDPAAFLFTTDELMKGDTSQYDALRKADAILTALASGSGDHAELARLAEAATPGPWSAADWDDDFGEDKFTVQATEPEELSLGQSSIWPDGIRCLRVAETVEGERPAEDAAFIAAANPAAVLALIAEVAALRSSLKKANGGFEEYERKFYLEQDSREEAERKLAEAVGLLTGLCIGTPTVKVRAAREWLSKEAERG